MSVVENRVSSPDSFFVDSSSELDRLLQELVDESTDEQITNLDYDELSVSESLKKLLLESDDNESELRAPRPVEVILQEADFLRNSCTQPHVTSESGDGLQQIDFSEDGQNCIKIDTYSQTEIQPCIAKSCYYITQYHLLLSKLSEKQSHDKENIPDLERAGAAKPAVTALQTKSQTTQTRRVGDIRDIGMQCDPCPQEVNIQNVEAREKYEMTLAELKDDFMLLKVRHEAQVKELKHQLELQSQPFEPLLSHSELQKQLQQQRKQIEVLTQQNNCHSSKERDYLDALNVLRKQLADKQKSNINLKKELNVLQKQNCKLERDKSLAVSHVKPIRPSSVPRDKSLNCKVSTLLGRVEQLEKALEEKNNLMAHLLQEHKEQLQAAELQHHADGQLLKAKSTMNDSNHQYIDELKSQIKALQNTIKTYEEKVGASPDLLLINSSYFQFINLNRLEFQLEHSNEEKAFLESHRATLQMKLDWCKKALSPKQSLLFEIQEKVYIFQQKASAREQELLDLIQKMRISLAGVNYPDEKGLV